MSHTIINATIVCDTPDKLDIIKSIEDFYNSHNIGMHLLDVHSFDIPEVKAWQDFENE